MHIPNTRSVAFVKQICMTSELLGDISDTVKLHVLEV